MTQVNRVPSSRTPVNARASKWSRLLGRLPARFPAKSGVAADRGCCGEVGARLGARAGGELSPGWRANRVSMLCGLARRGHGHLVCGPCSAMRRKPTAPGSPCALLRATVGSCGFASGSQTEAGTIGGSAKTDVVDLLMLGGTRFVGRVIVAEALAGGWQVTALNRGITRQLPPEMSLLRAARRDAEQLRTALAGRTFDAVIDTWSGAPKVATTAAAALVGSAARYAYVSGQLRSTPGARIEMKAPPWSTVMPTP